MVVPGSGSGRAGAGETLPMLPKCGKRDKEKTFRAEDTAMPQMQQQGKPH